MVGSWPSHVQTGIAHALAACNGDYPVSIVLAPTEIRELSADDPDREYHYTLPDGSPVDLYYTHSVVVYYDQMAAAMYGITPAGDAHLWCD